MIPYWVLFSVVAYLALNQPNDRTKTTRDGWIGFGLVLTLVIGFRFQVGGDWGNYLRNLGSIENLALIEALMKPDPAHQLFGWVSVKLGWGIYGINLAYGAIFSYGLITFCRAQPRPWVGITVAVPYLVIVVAMGYSRQAVAIGFAMVALLALSEQKVLKFVVLIGAAALFHKTAVILIPMAILANTHKKTWTALWVGLTLILLYKLLVEADTERLVQGYLVAGYASSGGPIRVAMNVLPAALFLYYRNRFELTETNRLLWTWISLGALALVPVFYLSPSSTAVDRIALYFIPIQIFVFSRLPIVFGMAGYANRKIEQQIIILYALVQFVWLFYATHAKYWIPYQFYWLVAGTQ